MHIYIYIYIYIKEQITTREYGFLYIYIYIYSLLVPFPSHHLALQSYFLTLILQQLPKWHLCTTFLICNPFSISLQIDISQQNGSDQTYTQQSGTTTMFSMKREALFLVFQLQGAKGHRRFTFIISFHQIKEKNCQAGGRTLEISWILFHLL